MKPRSAPSRLLLLLPLILKDTFRAFSTDKVPRLGAALAYYTIFSLAPLLMICIAAAGFIFGAEASRGEIMKSLQGAVGPLGAAAIEEMIKNAKQPGTGALAATLGFVALLFGASGVFGELQESLDMIWGVAPRPGRTFLTLLRQRFLSFAMVLGVAFLLLVSLILTTALSAVLGYFSQRLPVHSILMHGINFTGSFVMITFLFAAIFKVLPDAKVAWNDTWIGAAFTAFLFSVGKFLIGLYLGNSSVASVYGAAGSLVILLVWVYYSAQILFLGAEFTQIYARRFGSKLEPKPHAVIINFKKIPAPPSANSS